MSEKKSDDVIGKLGKVADSLETATINLSSVVTQQQLDVARERISKCEADTQSLKAQIESFIANKNEALDDLAENLKKAKKDSKALERDFSGMRALTLSSFVVSLICLAGVVLCLTRL
jgi:hypothetical protein